VFVKGTTRKKVEPLRSFQLYQSESVLPMKCGATVLLYVMRRIASVPNLFASSQLALPVRAGGGLPWAKTAGANAAIRAKVRNAGVTRRQIQVRGMVDSLWPSAVGRHVMRELLISRG